MRDYRRTLENTRTARGSHLSAATTKNRLAAIPGRWAWDLSGGGLPADFDEATYHAAS
ncbi:hypothetical protein [Nocardiopsis ansamitocini]|uniref:hypothetical protein n=1 Tax=Nocardiopsis ansamitocini TaxID=1670832 RepID=UPI00255726D6|nr:hypothetical protein [Nocardiopsis ansamitocini]